MSNLESSNIEMDDLCVDRSLLNVNFDHYLLASRSPTMSKCPLQSGMVLSVLPSAKQFGYQHIKLFTNVDRLVLDLFQRTADHLYFFHNDGSLMKVIYNQTSTEFNQPFKVADIPLSSDAINTFPPSLIFPNDQLAVVGNGNGQLCIFETSDRSQNTQWKAAVTLNLTPDASNFNLTSNATGTAIPFVVLDCRSTGSVISVLLHCILEKEAPGQSLFTSRLLWMEISNGTTGRRREISFSGHLETASLNHSASEVITIGTVSPRLIFDSVKPIEEPMEMETKTEEPQKPLYVWTQDAEEITITFALGETVNRSDVKFTLKSPFIELEVKERIVLRGDLESAVHSDPSTWTLSDNTLQLTLFKVRGHFWKELIPGDHRGLYQANADAVAAATDSLMKFTSDSVAVSGNDATPSFNAEQLEECDTASEDLQFIHWLDGEAQRIVKSVNIGSSPVLFRTQLNGGAPPAIATRNDNDGIVWSLAEGDLAAGQRIAHRFTLNAFGYIYAGHSARQFVGCSPDGGYAVVVHTTHHSFVYRQNVPVGEGCQLKNRRTGREKPTVAEQLILNTAFCDSPTIGFVAANSVLYLLLRDQIVAFHIE